MKKIILLLINCVIILGCSSDDENHSSELTQKLIGTWKVVGYYDDVEDNYPLIEDGPIVKFKRDGSFEQVNNSSEIYNGHFSVSKDSVLTKKYTTYAFGEEYTFVNKIFIINDSILGTGPEHMWAMTLYEKIND